MRTILASNIDGKVEFEVGGQKIVLDPEDAASFGKQLACAAVHAMAEGRFTEGVEDAAETENGYWNLMNAQSLKFIGRRIA